MKYILNVMIFLIFAMYIGCTNNCHIVKNKYDPIDKEIEILKKVSNEIIVQNIDYINSRKEWKCTQPLFLKICQQKVETNGFKLYTAFFSESGFYGDSIPNCLWKKKNVYVPVYLDGREILTKSEIPENLLKDFDDDYSRFESSWLILICNDTYKTKVIDKGLVLYLAVKQFQEFSCDIDDVKNGKIIIEDADVDTDLMDGIMNSLPIGR